MRAACHALARQARDRLHALTGQEPPCPDSPEGFSQLVTVRLPERVDGGALKQRLWDDYRIELPIHLWNGVPLLRVSVQGYNTQQEVDALVKALSEMLSVLTGVSRKAVLPAKPIGMTNGRVATF